MIFKYNKFFEEIGEKVFYNEYLKNKRDEFEPYFEDLIRYLKISNGDRFDTNVKININLFENYTTEELNSLFGEINKYNNVLTEIELLACRLSNITHFEIKDPVLKTEIILSIKDFYVDKNKDEILNCYTFDEKVDKMNAYDFMVGFQNYANKQCKIINEVDNDGLSLFFKVYKTLYKGSFDHTFTDENINSFVVKIKKAIDILKLIYNVIFMENLVASGKIFDGCNKKLDSLKKNNVYLILVTIIGYIEKKEKEEVLLKSIEKCLLFHFFVNEISDKDKKEVYKIQDSILYEAGGAYIDNMAEKMYKNPSLISDKIEETIMLEVLDILIKENIKPKPYETRSNGKDKIDKRRNRKFHEKALLYYYYRNRIPTEFLKYHFWIEHICPFSCSWEGEIDIERMGNILPIVDELNGKRSNKHISEYNKNDKFEFINYVNDVIPNDEIYNQIVKHDEKKPHVHNTTKFNELCEQNESIFKKIFIKHLF
jgi:hypothetical protein